MRSLNASHKNISFQWKSDLNSTKVSMRIDEYASMHQFRYVLQRILVHAILINFNCLANGTTIERINYHIICCLNIFCRQITAYARGYIERKIWQTTYYLNWWLDLKWSIHNLHM